MTQILAIFVGGGLGSLARFGVGQLVLNFWKSSFPLGTLAANILSCIALGIAVGVMRDKVLAEPLLKAFLVIGFCGGFSTFSTFSLETQELFRNQNYTFALANIGISLLFCIGLLLWLTKTQPSA